MIPAGGVCSSKNLNQKFVGFALCCSKFGEVLCNLLGGEKEGVEKNFEIGGVFRVLLFYSQINYMLY